MSGKRVLVTGGTGYIGSHTVVELQSAGYTPVIIDDLSNSSEAILNQIAKITGIKPEFYCLDLSDDRKVREFAKANQDISSAIHFAAFKAVGESVEQPLKYYRNNLFSLINILESFSGREFNMVFSSSCTVYGQPDVLPVTEAAPVKKAESPYGNTKQIAEEILEETTRAGKQLKVISLRYFNPVGAHASALIGELPIGVPQNLVPFITQSAIGKRGPISIFGSDYDTPDGSAVRDYIHVVDLARAHVAAIDLMAKSEEAYNVFNVGTGKGLTVLEVIGAFEQATGIKLNYALAPRREGDIEKIWGEVSRAETELGWKALHDVNEMMRSAWAWEKYIQENPL